MKLLLKAAFKGYRHLTLLVISFVALFALTIANQVEMVTLGILTNTGTDFFKLFSKEEKKMQSKGVVTIDDIRVRFDKIDKDKKGYITQEDASDYLAEKGDNPLGLMLHQVKKKFRVDNKNLKVFITLFILVAIYKALCLFFSRFVTRVIAIRISRDLRQKYFDHIQSLPMSFYQKYNIGTLSSRVVGDASQIANSINSCITNYIHTPFTVITSLFGCFYLSWQLSLVIFIGLPLIVLPIIFVTKKVKKVTRQLLRNQERFASVLIDFLAGIQTVKIFAMESFSFKKYKEENDKMVHLEVKTAKYDLLTRPILHTISVFCLTIVLVFGLYGLKMSLSQLIVFCGLLHLFYEPVKKFADENANVQKGVVAAERLYEVLDLQPHIEDADGAIPLDGIEQKIEFDKVWFKYENTWVLKGVSFEINKGEVVAIVGATGAGKSTIVQLLPRLYEPQKGEIRIDGKPINTFSQKSLREQISFVPQKPFLFYDTIRANISYGQKHTLEEIEIAAKKAHAFEFIDKLEKKFESHLAETGKNLSGGQQQRLAIARALFKNAPILILDEATSSLDSISESNIQEAIDELRGQITQIIIAHRLSTIEHADRIIFLENGELLAQGTKEELITSCPPFKLMWDTHFREKTPQEKVSDLLEKSSDKSSLT